MEKLCILEPCQGKYYAKGYCRKHYQRYRKSGTTETTKSWGTQARECVVSGCSNSKRSMDMCNKHYLRYRKHGDPEVNLRPGGKRKKDDGYIILSGYQSHPNSYKNGTILEHTLVMSESLGRPLLTHENVHHKNGVRDDNRPENLELWSKSQPAGQRVDDKVAWAIELLQTYRPELLVNPTKE